MLKIGDFSKLGRVTVKTLRYWDEIGILKPDFVNTENGYRYYNSEKLALVFEIQSMKDIGLYLEDIAGIIRNGLHKNQWLDLLRSRRVTLVDEINLHESKLVKLDQMISQIEKEKHMEKVEIRELPKVIVASYRTTIPDYNALFTVAPAMGELMKKQGAICSDPPYCFNIYHDGEYREKDIDVEICESVVNWYKNDNGITYKEIAAVSNAAVIAHHGPYETLGKSYSTILSWIENNGYEVTDNPRESYIDGIWNKDNSEDWLTEIQIPVKKRQ